MDEKSKKDKGKDLTVASQGIDIFERFDALDDQIIIDELENRVIDAWVYHFKPKNAREVWGIGKAGIDGCVIMLGKKGIALREDDVRYEIDPTNSQYVLFTAKVAKHLIEQSGAEAMVESALGTKRQWTRMLLKDGKTVVPDPFWFEKGSIKALRNAKSRLIPEEIKAKIITFAKSKGKVREIKENNSEHPENEHEGDGLNTPVTAEQKVKIGKLETRLTDKFDIDQIVLVQQFEKEFKGRTIEEINTLDGKYWISLLESRVKREEEKVAK